MKTHEAEVKKFLSESKYFKGKPEDTIILNNGTAIAMGENDDFAKYSLVSKNGVFGNYRSETNVSNSVLSMLALSIVVDKAEHGKESAFGFLEMLLEVGNRYENDTEIANELRYYDGELLEFLIKKSKVVNDNNYDTYKEIIERVVSKK